MTATTQSRSNSNNNNRIKQQRSQQVRGSEDFYESLLGSFVTAFLPNQQVRGVLNKVSRFQIGLLVNGEQVYINKGFIIMIKPEQPPRASQAMQGGDDHGSRRLVG